MVKPASDILCVFPFEYGLAQQIFEGIQEYASAETGRPAFHIAVKRDDILELTKASLVAGMICFGGNRGVINDPAVKGFRIINVSASLRKSPVPSVVNDDRAAGRLAGLHLARTRPRQAICVTSPTGHHYKLRVAGAREAFGEARIAFREYALPYGESGSFHRRSAFVQEIMDTHAREILLGSGVFPLAIVCSDYRIAELMVLTARELNLEVPGQVRVIGIGNPTDRFSFLRQTGISYVPLNWKAVGHKAAAALAGWIESGDRPAERSLIYPGDVVIEESSLAPTESVVERTQLLIRESRDYALTVEEIAARLEMSVGTLINRFRRESDQTPKEMLIRWRMEFARELLKHTHEEVAAIAAKCGYADHSTFTTAFKKFSGASPSKWRGLS